MAGIFPDSGVPASQAANTVVGAKTTVGCTALFHSSSRCAPRFDPASANAVISEIINLVNAAGLQYDCTKLTNLVDAIVPRIQTFFNDATVNIPLTQNVWTAPPLGSPSTYGAPFGTMAGTVFTFTEAGVYEVTGHCPVFNECRTDPGNPAVQANPWVAAGYEINGTIFPNDACAPGGSTQGQGLYYVAGKPRIIEVAAGDLLEYKVNVTNGENAFIWKQAWLSGAPAVPTTLTIRKIR